MKRVCAFNESLNLLWMELLNSNGMGKAKNSLEKLDKIN